jgi:cell division protein FtsW
MKKALKFDLGLALTIGFLLVFGLIMITSIGVPKSISLSAPDVLFPNCSDDGVDCHLLLKKHVIRLIIGLIAAVIALKIPMKWWRKLAPLIFGASFLSLMYVLLRGDSYGTIASSWIVVAGISIQPSEFAKLALILYLAYWFSKRQHSVASFSDGFIPFCLISGVLVLPVLLQNDFGSTIVMAIIAVAIYIIAGARTRHLAIGFLVALIGAIIVVTQVDHVKERFQGFSSIDEDCLENYCWQSQQANIAVGSGGFFGKGLTQGVQKSYWLPQASDDFIFAASAEELGFIRIILVVIAYFYISLRGYQIANKTRNVFQSLVAVGITTWIVAQAFINIAVNIALMPVTGITLPFISYGGSSLIATLAAVGILLNISEFKTNHETSIHRGRKRRSRRAKPRYYRRA